MLTKGETIVRSVSLAMMIAVPAEEEATVSVSEVSACALRMILIPFAANLEKLPEPEEVMSPV